MMTAAPSAESERIPSQRDIPGIMRLIVALGLVSLGCFLWYYVRQPMLGLMLLNCSNWLFSRWNRSWPWGENRDPVWDRVLTFRDWIGFLLVLGAIGLLIFLGYQNRSWLDPIFEHFYSRSVVIAVCWAFMFWAQTVQWRRLRRAGVMSSAPAGANLA